VSTHTIGVNYQLASQAVLKAEYEMDFVPDAGGGGVDVTQTANTSDKFGSALYAGIDFIF
jgi:hypothetical protein